MRVDIWSDIRCPFCYIGKHNFEAALEDFDHKDEVEVRWHSFELDPNLESNNEESTLDYFVKVKGVTKEQAHQMFSRVRQMASDINLDLDPEKSVVANSFRAHKLLQLAKKRGVANDMKESLFRAHFSEGKDIDDQEDLLEIAASAGIDGETAREALRSQELSAAVRKDEAKAQEIGVQGVPFFVFNNKYGVSGAQPPSTFLDVLKKARKENHRD